MARPSYEYSGVCYITAADQTTFALTTTGGNAIGYLEGDHIKVRWSDDDGVSWTDLLLSTDWVFDSPPDSITLTSALATGSWLDIHRETPVTDDYIRFNEGSLLTAAQLNEFDTSQLYIDQEIIDSQGNLTGSDIVENVSRLRAGPNIQLSPSAGVGEVQISAIKDSDDTFWELVGDDLHPKGDDIDVSVGDGNIVLDHSGNATFDGNVGIGTKIDLEGSTGSITAKGTTNNVRVSLIGEGLSIGAQINAYNDYGSFFHGISGDTSGDYIYYTAEEKNHLFYTQGLPRVVINSSGNVFIGGTTLQSHPNMDDLQIGDASGNRGITISSGADSFGSLAFGCSTDTSGNDRYVGMVEYYHVDDSMRFYANISERMRITSNGTIQLPNGSPGIQFGSIPSPQPDSRTITGTTLDDYEEGGWTPGIAENGLGGVQWDTITAVSGSYIRVGKMVTVMFRIDYSGLPTNINLAFYGYITGLPFAGATADENMHAQNIAMIGPSESNILYHSAWANQANSLSVFKSQNNLPPGPMRSENFPDQATQIRGCFTYLTP